MDYTGFVYIWLDKKYSRYYIGSHKGTIDDGYIGSNTYLKNAYTTRPLDFKRRILFFCSSDNLLDLQNKEQYYLDMIKDSELYSSINVKNKTIRYYNIKKIARGGSTKGHKKNRIKPAWNKGFTKEEISLRSKGLLCFISDKPVPRNPKKSQSLEYTCKKCCSINTRPKHSTRMICDSCKKSKNILTKECMGCSKLFQPSDSRSNFCSKSCRGKHNGRKSNHANNGKIGAEKQRKTVTGRTRLYKEDGSWCWQYPDKNRGS